MGRTWTRFILSISVSILLLYFDLATWLDEIFIKERIENPIVIGQSMGGYVGTGLCSTFPEKLKGLVTIDSPSPSKEVLYSYGIVALKKYWRQFIESIHGNFFEIRALKAYQQIDYGRKLMYDMMMVYDGDQEKVCSSCGYGL